MAITFFIVNSWKCDLDNSCTKDSFQAIVVFPFNIRILWQTRSLNMASSFWATFWNAEISRKFRSRFYSNLFVNMSIILLRNDAGHFLTMSAMRFEKINFEEKWRCFYFASLIQMASFFGKLIYQQQLSIITVTSVKIWVQLNRNWRRSWSLKIRATRYSLRSKHLN